MTDRTLIIAFGCLVAPLVILIILGLVWLQERELLLAWVALGTVISLIGWPIFTRMRQGRAQPVTAEVLPVVF